MELFHSSVSVPSMSRLSIAPPSITVMVGIGFRGRIGQGSLIYLMFICRRACVLNFVCEYNKKN